jgi:hypothetical protein
MAQTKNTFLKGKMNQDLDSRIVPVGEYREAINLLVSRSEGSTVGEFENVLGNTSIIDTGNTKSIIGYAADDTNNIIYLFATDWDDVSGNTRAPSTKNCGIYKYDVNANNLSTLVVGYFLNFNKSFRITGVNLIEELLFWTDNLNQPRKINVTLASVNSSHYTTEEQISVAKYYPYKPIEILDRYTTTIDDTMPSASYDIVINGDTSNIKVGDIITDYNKAPGVTPIITTQIKVVAILDSTNLKLDTKVQWDDDFYIDFSRTTMKDEAEPYVSNWCVGGVVFINDLTTGYPNPQVANTTEFVLNQGNSGLAANNTTGGLPRIGDIVTCESNANRVPVGTTITQMVCKHIAGGLRLYIKLSKATTLTVGDNIAIGNNQFYNSSFTNKKVLEDKFVRFSYRFKFEDNEYSLMAPFSQPMFIPKQDGDFGKGQQRDADPEPDMDEAYKSTIVAWFENKITTIKLRAPMPYATPAALTSHLKITEIDLLYRESNSLAVTVLDKIKISDLEQATSFNNIGYNDIIHTLNTQYYYDYTYDSSKPYKTLPESQTVRVYDKVPIKALAQELISNRIVYGNYIDKHTSASSIDYKAGVNTKSLNWDNFIEYPTHTAKQNRTYQVGWILADKYGRQSDVILSSYDSSDSLSGSTIYSGYNTYGDQTANPVINWLGDALTVRLDKAIGPKAPNHVTGWPGLYSEVGHVASVKALTAAGTGYIPNTFYTTSGGDGSGCTVLVTSVSGGGGSGPITELTIINPGSGYSQDDILTIVNAGTSNGNFKINIGEENPLGWYSYKIVVKQQEQDYYNVYLSGFTNGYPVINGGEGRYKFSFSTLLSDNINKIPRDLKEVGPTDTEFNSSEVLFIRVNTPNINNKNANRPYGIPRKQVPWNAQYYPGTISQNVLSIATVKDMELVSIPFVNTGTPLGPYGEMVITQVGADDSGWVNTPTALGSVPWGVSPSVAAIYNTDENPMILKFSTSQNGPINLSPTDIPTSAGVVGADVNSTSTVVDQNTIYSCQPYLSVVETKPVYSLLEIFFETSLSGKIDLLNAMVNAQYDGVIEMEQHAASFPESQAPSTNIGTPFNFIDGGGSAIIDGTTISAVIQQVVDQTGADRTAENLFTLTESSAPADGEFQLGISAGEYFWYNANSNSPGNSTDIFTLTFRTTYTPLSEAYIDDIGPYTITLTNEAPEIDSFTITAPTLATTTIHTFTGVNGTNTSNTTEKTLELFWDLDPDHTDYEANNAIFSMSSAGALTVTGTMVENTQYNVGIRLTDINGAGLTDTDIATFTVGLQHTPRAICCGWNGTTYATCDQNSEWLFAETASTDLDTGGSYDLAGYNWPPDALYNVRAQGDCEIPSYTTGALTAGTMKVIPTLTSTCTTSDVVIYYSIQYRETAEDSWIPASCDVDSPAQIAGGEVSYSIQLSATNGAPDADEYWFSTAGEYRVFTKNMTGGACGSVCGVNKFYVEFDDKNYPKNGDYGANCIGTL